MRFFAALRMTGGRKTHFVGGFNNLDLVGVESQAVDERFFNLAFAEAIVRLEIGEK